MTVSKVHGEPVFRPNQIKVGSVIVAGRNGVRYRVIEIIEHPMIWQFSSLYLVPIDNPLPRPRGNALGTYPMTLAIVNVVGSVDDRMEPDWRPSNTWRLLTDPYLLSLDSPAYAVAIDMAVPNREWVAYEDGATS